MENKIRVGEGLYTKLKRDIKMVPYYNAGEFSLDWLKAERDKCSHPDIASDGGGDYCKICGYRWTR